MRPGPGNNYASMESNFTNDEHTYPSHYSPDLSTGLTLILVGMFYEWVDRKLVARFQNRIGPRWFQPFADAVKLFAKEQITPAIVNPYLFFGLPVAALAGALTSALYVPLMGLTPASNFPGDLIVTIYLLSLPTMCVGLAGWNNSGRFSLIGATRTLTQLFAYEAPFLLALLGPALVAGSWQINTINRFHPGSLAHPSPACWVYRGIDRFDGQARTASI